MSILFAGGEDIDFPTPGSLTVVTTSSNFRSGYGRCALQMNTSNSSVAKTNAFTAQTNMWVSFRYFVSAFVTARKILGLGKSGATPNGIFVGNASSSGKVTIGKTDGTTDTVLATESGTSLTSATIIRIDVHVSSFGASGTVEVFVNGASAVSFTGNLVVNSIADLDQVHLWGGSTPGSISEIVAADEDSRLFSVVTMPPNANGDANAWTNTFAAIDEITLDDTDLVSSATTGQAAQYNLGTIPSGDFSVRAIRIAARACCGATGITGLKLGIKTSSTIDLDTAHVQTTAFATNERVMQSNPVTSNNWLTSEMGALQLAIESLT